MTLGFTRIGLKAGTAILVLGLAAAAASAQNTNADPPPFSGDPGRGRGPGGPGRGGPMGFLGPIPMLASQLELNDAQKDQIKSIAQSHAEEWKGLLDRERAGREALQAAITTAQLDEVTIRQRSAEVAAVDADIAVARARARGEFLQVLTATQQAKLKAMEAQRPMGPQGRGRRDRG